MIEILGIVGAAGAMATVLYLSRRAHAERVADWRHAAANLGFRAIGRRGIFDWSLRASSPSMRLKLRSIGANENQGALTEIVLAPLRSADRECGVQVASSRWGLDRTALPAAAATGDPVFDALALLSGPEARLLAVLDEATRSNLVSVAREASFQFAVGRATARVQESALEGYRTAFLRPLLAAVGRLAAPLDVPAELSRNAREDRIPGVRSRNLTVLVEQFPDSPQTGPALETARNDRAPQVRLVAGQALGDAGRETLAEITENAEAPDLVVAAALRSLGRGFPVERLIGALELALRKRRFTAAATAIDLLARSRTDEGRAVIERVLVDPSSDLAHAAATALRRLGSPASEPALVARLEEAPLELARVLVAALGRAGTAASVAALRAVTAREPGDRPLARAVDQAIAAIRLRTPGASEGQLSLAGAEVGALSFAAGERGALALADGPRPSPSPGSASGPAEAPPERS